MYNITSMPSQLSGQRQTAQSIPSVKPKGVRRLVNKVRRGRAVTTVTQIYLETGWLTPTIALVLLSEIVRGGQTLARKLPKVRK